MLISSMEIRSITITRALMKPWIKRDFAFIEVARMIFFPSTRKKFIEKKLTEISTNSNVFEAKDLKKRINKSSINSSRNKFIPQWTSTSRCIIKLFHRIIDGLIHRSWDSDVIHAPSGWSSPLGRLRFKRDAPEVERLIF